MLKRIRERIIRYEKIESENNNADNQLNVANQHNGYNNTKIKDTLENVLAQMDSLSEIWGKE